jgi:hypothetical protein
VLAILRLEIYNFGGAKRDISIRYIGRVALHMTEFEGSVRPNNEAFTQRRKNSKELADTTQNNGAIKPVHEKRIGWGNSERTVFDCVVPEVIPSPFHIRRMLRDEILTEEQALELEQQWLGELRTMDRRDLEGEERWWETMRGRFTEEQKIEEVQEIEQQLDIIREQLQQRGVQ